MKKAFAVLVLLVFIIGFAGATGPEPKYKYQYFRAEPIYFQRTLDAAGADGYRVVTILWMDTYYFIVMEKQYFLD